MTKKQRAELVELLRCGADIVHESLIPLSRAQVALDASAAQLFEAVRVRCVVSASNSGRAFFAGEEYREELLEAAARVEEGSYP